MKDNEIVQALRCCAKGLGHDDACENCKIGEIQDRREYIEFAAANAIERLTAENADLRKEIEWKDTGLEPEAVETVKLALAARHMVDLETLNNTPISRLVELAEADKDGRVVVLAHEERTLDFSVKYTEICALYHFCIDLGIKCTIERLHDGYAVRFPDGSDFAQHHGTYGGTEGCVEPAIGDHEFDYTAVGLNLAKELVKKHKGKLEGKKNG